MTEAATGGRIKAVEVLSTGTGSIHAEHQGGSVMPSLWWVLFSRDWVEVPINVFVIEHVDGLVLFDTGVDLAVKTNPQYVDSALGRFFMWRLFRLKMSSNDTLVRKLEALGYSAKDVQKAVISHLHFDHVGGIADIPQAELIVSAREWELLSGPWPKKDFIIPEYIDLPGSKWNKVAFAPSDDPIFSDFEGAYDVMGDGSMIYLPTPGHTAGSSSLLVRDPGMAPLLLVGDLCYTAQYLMEDRFPGTGEVEQLRASYEKVRKLKRDMPGLVILPSHDPDSENRLQRATQGAEAV